MALYLDNVTFATRQAPLPTATPTATPTPTPTATPAPTPTPTPAPTPTPGGPPTPTPTATATPTPTPTATPIPCIGHLWYLHNNPTPPTGDTTSQADLPMDQSSPTATTLYNYDTDRDGDAGRVIAKGGSGASEIDLGKMQNWRTAALTADECINGTVTVTLWAAIKDYGLGKAGEIVVYLRDYNGSTYTEIGNGSVFNADWQGGSSTWVQATVNIPGLSYTIPSGNVIEVKLVVGGQSGDDMWIAYDTAAYPAEVDIVTP